jgi:hypothetical protein
VTNEKVTQATILPLTRPFFGKAIERSGTDELTLFLCRAVTAYRSQRLREDENRRYRVTAILETAIYGEVWQRRPLPEPEGNGGAL